MKELDLEGKTPKVLRIVGPVLIAAVFLGACWLLYHEVKHYRLSDVRRSLTEVPASQIALALALTVVNYVILIGYDLLAVQSIRRHLPLRRIALASFTGFVMSYNFGAVLGGTPVRFRLYSSWGLSAIDIARLLFMLGLTFWFGIFALGGVAFLFDPLLLPSGLPLPFQTVRPLGGVLLMLALGYVAMSALWTRPISFRGVTFELPGPRVSAQLLAVSATDLVVAASVLYVLMPAGFGIGFFQFLSIYLLAAVVVIFSHVPGGVGVFELMVLKLAGAEANEGVIAGLLIFRGMYYLLPLVFASVLLAGREFLEHRAGLQRQGIDQQTAD